MIRPVLITVDDDPQVLAAIARDLRTRYTKSYRILRAESGDEALKALETLRESAEPVALILSDQRMPQLDGVSFLARARELYPSAKRALLTAYADTDAAIAAINRSQVDYYLQKPWDPPDRLLYPVIDDLLDDWRATYRPGYGGVRVIASRFTPAAHDVKDFLARNHVPYEFFDLEAAGERGDEARNLVDGAALPLVILPGGERLAAPALNELARKVGLKTEARNTVYDVAIVGAGPAGLAAAVYAASEGLQTILLDREAPGGQAGTSSRIENYLGFPSGVSGSDLARRALTQARKFEVEVITPIEVDSLRLESPFKYLNVSGPEHDAREIACKALMLTTGLMWQRLPAECAEQFEGRGIYYGAATTEALNCRDQIAFVVGAGNSAGQAAIHLAQYAKRVVMVVRGANLAEKMSRYLVDRIERRDDEFGRRIEVLYDTEVAGCRGRDHLEGMTLVNRSTGEKTDVDTAFLFVFIGAVPRTTWLGSLVARDGRGFILTGPDLDRDAHLKEWPLPRSPYLLEASVPGIFAAGDVRHESIKRVASAVGEGSVAVHFIHRYLASL
jgi:thioredoxin reductase (NADPH)